MRATGWLYRCFWRGDWTRLGKFNRCNAPGGLLRCLIRLLPSYIQHNVATIFNILECLHQVIFICLGVVCVELYRKCEWWGRRLGSRGRVSRSAAASTLFFEVVDPRLDWSERRLKPERLSAFRILGTPSLVYGLSSVYLAIHSLKTAVLLVSLSSVRDI